jgi:hypothetical protein
VRRASSTSKAGLCEAILQLPLELADDLVAAGAQRERAVRFVDVVVRIFVREMAQRRLGLHRHVLFIVIDVEHRARRVADAPDDGGRDLDRIAAFVVDLELLAVEVAQTQRHLHLVEERIRPAQPRRVVRAAVRTEQHDQRRLVRLQHVDALHQEDEDEDREQREQRQSSEHGQRNRHQRDENEYQRHVAARALEIDFFRTAWRIRIHDSLRVASTSCLIVK